MALKVDASDVIKVILQFLKENSLYKAYAVLEEESQVSVNSVDNVDSLKHDIENGHWENVLKVISPPIPTSSSGVVTSVGGIRLPVNKLALLYEQIVLELAESREVETAKALLRGAEPLVGWLRQQDPGRYLKLDKIVQQATRSFDAFDAYDGKTKEALRAHLAKEITKEVAVVPPSRLLTLISQALKFQQEHGILKPGSQYDLFKDTQKAAQELAIERLETFHIPVKRIDAHVTFGSKSHANVAKFPPDGQCIVTGSTDGFVEIWDYTTGRLRLDLEFQKKDEIMLHDDAVLALAFSSDSDMLASGSQDGKIKVWQLYTGKCLRRFEAAHTKGVTCLAFSRDNTQILSGSFDATLKIHGLRSGKSLKTLRSHTSFVNDCAFTQDGTKILSASRFESFEKEICLQNSDGTVKIWDSKTAECIQTIRPTESIGGFDASVQTIQFVPRHPDQFVVCNRSSIAYLMSMKGQVIRKYTPSPTITSITSDQAKGHESAKLTGMVFISALVSPNCDFVYCLGDDCNLYCFDFITAELVSTIKAHEKEPFGLAHHPYLNILATFADGPLRIWKP